MPERISLIGVGPEGAPSLLPPAAACVADADLLVGGSRLLACFPDVSAERLVLGAEIGQTIAVIAQRAETERVAVLASGDPLFFGIGRALLTCLSAERVTIYPQVSALQLAFARIGEPWDDARLLSVHGRPLASLAQSIRTATKVAILTDAANTPARIAQELLDDGQAGWHATVCADLGTQEESIASWPLEELPPRECSPLNVLVLLRAEAPELPAPGLPDSAFDCRRTGRGLITKFEARALAVTQLRLRRESVVWDIGAGSGSVTIEAALRATEGRIYAVERDAESIANIRANCARHGTTFVRVIEGTAPEALQDLPAPDAVFIGGSRGRLEAILEICRERLSARGRIVVSAATLETLAAARAGLASGWRTEITQIAAARGTAIGPLTRLEAENPVFLVMGARV